MSNLEELYKVFYKMTQTEKEEENKEEFSAISLKIRNKNKDGSYRFYDEDGQTVSIKAQHLNGVFLTNNLISESPSITSYLITEDKEMFELVTGVVPPKDKEEEEGLASLKHQMKNIVEDSLTQFIERLKRATENIDVKDAIALTEEEINVKHECSHGCQHE